KVCGLRELDAQDGLPSLLPVDLVLWRREPGILPAADHLVDHIANDVGEISKEYDSSRRGSEIRSRSNVAKATCATIRVRAAGPGRLTAFAHRGPRRVIAPASRVSSFTTSGEWRSFRLAVAGATMRTSLAATFNSRRPRC